MTTNLNARLHNARQLRDLVSEAIIQNLRNELIGTTHEFTSSKWKGGEVGWEESIVEGTVTGVEWDSDGDFLIKWESGGSTGTAALTGTY